MRPVLCKEKIVRCLAALFLSGLINGCAVQRTALRAELPQGEIVSFVADVRVLDQAAAPRVFAEIRKAFAFPELTLDARYLRSSSAGSRKLRVISRSKADDLQMRQVEDAVAASYRSFPAFMVQWLPELEAFLPQGDPLLLNVFLSDPEVIAKHDLLCIQVGGLYFLEAELSKRLQQGRCQERKEAAKALDLGWAFFVPEEDPESYVRFGMFYLLAKSAGVELPCKVMKYLAAAFSGSTAEYADFEESYAAFRNKLSTEKAWKNSERQYLLTRKGPFFEVK
jgi:hypothetical protein